MRRPIAAAALLLLAAAAVAADPADAVRDLDDGRLLLTYPSREGVVGSPHHLSLRVGPGERAFIRGCYDPRGEAAPGDVAALVRVRGGRVRAVELGVLRPGDPRPRADRDLGPVPAADAHRFFLDVARTALDDAAEDALFAAVVARDADCAPALAAYVRERRHPLDARESALFWLAVLAGEKALAEARILIDDPDEDLELRTHAVFALSQMDDERAFPLLMDVARRHPDPELRRSAYIWLAEYDRPEVVALFEEILLED